MKTSHGFGVFQEVHTSANYVPENLGFYYVIRSAACPLTDPYGQHDNTKIIWGDIFIFDWTAQRGQPCKHKYSIPSFRLRLVHTSVSSLPITFLKSANGY